MAHTKVNYAAFADLLSTYSSEIALLRFRELSVRNLLFYQAEFVHLQRQLQQIEDYDASLNPAPEKRVNHRWPPSAMAKTTTVPPQTSGVPPSNSIAPSEPSGSAASVSTNIADLYHEKMLQIRETLENYRECSKTLMALFLIYIRRRGA